MALKANSCDFFIGDDDENNSDPLSSDSDGGTEDTDSLSSLDSSDSDGMSRTSSDSMAYHDGEDEEQGYHPLMTKEMRECPISPEKQVALPNFLEVPTRKRVRGMRSGGSREHSSAIRFHPSATRFHPSNSPKLYFYRHDSRDKLLLDETTSPPEVCMHLQWNLPIRDLHCQHVFQYLSVWPPSKERTRTIPVVPGIPD